ncbi:MAG: hypothetical protein HUJ25_14880 [Crocinitomicaceae bacterium]|nr:hypothetical protein [Crocinitomicaceae bacterium]
MFRSILLLSILIPCYLSAQNVMGKHHYIGIQPSFLVEPYDTIKAVEVNIVPFNYEYRFDNHFSIQVRSMVNYRFYEPAPGISQTGGTVVFHKYFPEWLKEDFWLTPSIGGFSTYTYNQLDRINTIIAGAELGVLFSFGKWISLSVAGQPGINYYPDTYSQEFVGTSSGFKSHFGVIVHAGVNF